MSKIFDYASNRLGNLQPPLPPHQRVSLYLQYEDSLSEPEWLYPAVAELLEQVEPLDSEQARQVELELLQKIAWMREDLRLYMDGDGTFPLNRSESIRYVSDHLEGRPRRNPVAFSSARRRITE
jgi:hypothetical protein